MKKKVLLVRLVSEKLNSVGHPRNIRVPFLLKYMESILKRDSIYETLLLDCMASNMKLEGLIDVSIEYSPDIIVIFTTTLEYGLSLKYAGRVKKKSSPVIVAVGQDATASAQRYVYNGSPIDFVLRGESEFSLIKLLEVIYGQGDFSHIEGISTSHYSHPNLAFVNELEDLPTPIYEENELEGYRYYFPVSWGKRLVWGHLLSSRGCPYNCIFCSQTIRESYGKALRLRKPSDVIDEMMYLQTQGANFIVFADDNFTTSRNHVIGICEEIRKRRLKIRWTAHARVDNCDEDLLKIMKSAGCSLLRFGIESGSGKIIKILKKTDIENWLDRAREIFIAARKISLDTAALFLIGNPSETREDIEKTISFAIELSPDLVQVAFFTPYPGSPAYEEFKDKISTFDIEHMYHYSVSSLNFSCISSSELRKLYKKFYIKNLLSPRFLLNHFYKYSLFYIHNKETILKLCNIKRLIFN